MKNFVKFVLGLGALAMVPGVAQASDWIVTGKVTMVEATSMPNAMLFTMDTAGGNCGAGSLLSWNLNGADSATQTHNIEAAFAMLVTAKSTGQNIRIFGNNSGCSIDRMYIVQ